MSAANLTSVQCSLGSVLARFFLFFFVFSNACVLHGLHVSIYVLQSVCSSVSFVPQTVCFSALCSCIFKSYGLCVCSLFPFLSVPWLRFSLFPSLHVLSYPKIPQCLYSSISMCFSHYCSPVSKFPKASCSSVAKVPTLYVLHSPCSSVLCSSTSRFPSPYVLQFLNFQILMFTFHALQSLCSPFSKFSSHYVLQPMFLFQSICSPVSKFPNPMFLNLHMLQQLCYPSLQLN